MFVSRVGQPSNGDTNGDKKYVPTTVTMLSKHSPRADVAKAYKWVPNPSSMQTFRLKARIVEANNLQRFYSLVEGNHLNSEAEKGKRVHDLDNSESFR